LFLAVDLWEFCFDSGFVIAGGVMICDKCKQHFKSKVKSIRKSRTYG